MWNDPEAAYRITMARIDELHAIADRQRLGRAGARGGRALAAGRWWRLWFQKPVRRRQLAEDLDLSIGMETAECSAC